MKHKGPLVQWVSHRGSVSFRYDDFAVLSGKCPFEQAIMIRRTHHEIAYHVCTVRKVLLKTNEKIKSQTHAD